MNDKEFGKLVAGQSDCVCGNVAGTTRMIAEHPGAFLLAAVIACQSWPFTNKISDDGRWFGESDITDCESFGMSKQKFNAARKKLEREGLAVFRDNGYRIIGKLTDSTMFLIPKCKA